MASIDDILTNYLDLEAMNELLGYLGALPVGFVLGLAFFLFGMVISIVVSWLKSSV